MDDRSFELIKDVGVFLAGGVAQSFTRSLKAAPPF